MWKNNVPFNLVRWPQPPCECRSLGHHVLYPLPGPAQLRSAQARHEHGSFPPVPCKLEGFLLTESFKHLGQMQMHIKWHIYQCSADFGFVVRLELPFFVVFVFSYALLLQELKNRSPHRFQVKNEIWQLTRKEAERQVYERDDLFVHMRLCSAWACVVSLPHGRQSNEIGLITHFSEVAFLHERLRAAYVAWLPAVPCVDRAGVDAADVRCEEHDVFRL